MGFGFARHVGIDLGTATVQLCLRGRGVVLEEPCVAALERASGRLLAVGRQAEALLGDNPGCAVAVRPLRAGVVADYEVTQQLLRALLRRVSPRPILKPRVVIGVPTGITEVEERAVVDAALQAGAGRVWLVEEPLAAALGAGVAIDGPAGHMVVDIGGGTTDVAVLSMAGVVQAKSIPTAGDSFDAALANYLRRSRGLSVGRAAAEALKRQAGGVLPREEDFSVPVKGRCPETGLPKQCQVSANELPQAFEGPVGHILETIRAVVEDTPPELTAPLEREGILLTGGGSLLWGLDSLISRCVGLPVRRAEHPVIGVALGLEGRLEHLRTMAPGLRRGEKSRRISPSEAHKM